MANYELITISKGTIKTVDSFIKNFNAIGSNMKALSVSAYHFLTSDDKELKKDFQIRVMDELHMSKATLSYLKTAGYLYTLDDSFSGFAYTNVIFFKKSIDYFTQKNGCEINEKNLQTMFKEIALIGDSRLKEGFVEYLVSLSQKDLENIIKKYVSRETSEKKESKKDTPDENKVEVTPTDAVIEEVNAHTYMVLDDELIEILEILKSITPDTKKNDSMEKIALAVDRIERIME